MSSEEYELKLPTGAVVKLKPLSMFNLRMLVLEKIIVGFEKPGPYELEDGKLDPRNMMIRDLRRIDEWLAKTLLERIEEKIIAP